MELREEQGGTAVVANRRAQGNFPDATRSRARRQEQEHHRQRQAVEFGADVPRAGAILMLKGTTKTPRHKESRHQLISVAGFLCVLVSLWFQPTDAKAANLLIHGATLIDGTGRAPIANARILIECNAI